MEMKGMTLEVSCATTVSNGSAPGGRSASALAGALATALAEMVVQLAIGKKGYGEATDEAKAIIPGAAALCTEPLDEVTRDSTSFSAYMEAMTLPKDTDKQREVRRSTMQEALKRAAEVPPHVAIAATKIMPMADTMARKGNANAVTDSMMAIMMTRTAVLDALLNVKINLGSIKGEVYVADMKAKVHEVGTAIVRDEATVLVASPLK